MTRLACKVLFTLLVVFATSAHADTWQLRLHSVGVDKVSSGEPGDELELFGAVVVVSAIGDDGTMLWPTAGNVSLWYKSDDRTLDLKAGDALGTPNAFVSYELTEADIAKGAITVQFIASDYDGPSANDSIVSKVETYAFADGAQSDIVVSQETDGEKVSFVLSLAPSEVVNKLTAPKSNMIDNRMDNGAQIVKLQEFVGDHVFPKLASQVPKVDARLRVELGKTTVGDRYLLLDMSGTSVAASKDGKLDIDATTERGYYLEELDVKFSAPGLSIRNNYPTTTQKSGTQTNTVGASVGAEASLSGVSGGSSLSVSKATSVTYADFEVTNAGSQPLNHTYKLSVVEGSAYREAEDLLNGISLSLYELPQRAKANFPVDSWVLFQVPTADRGKKLGTVNVRVDFDMKLRFVDRRAPEFFWHTSSANYKLTVTYPVDMSLLN